MTSGLVPPVLEPWPEPVDGVELLDEIERALRRHLVLRPDEYTAVALWVVHAHAHHLFEISPRLAFIGPDSSCGKTTALGLVGELVPCPLDVGNITAAGIFRAIQKENTITLLIDELDTYLGRDEQIRGIINTGHRKAGASVVRCDGDDNKPRRFSTWAPLAMAKIGRLPVTLTNRSIVVRMRKRRRDEKIERIKDADHKRHAMLACKVARWVADHNKALFDAEPEIPSTLFNRNEDNWRPLFAIADAAEGQWPQKAREVAEAMTGTVWKPSRGVELLRDIRDIFAEIPEVDRLKSETLVDKLNGREDCPWFTCDHGRALTSTLLADMLDDYEINPRSIRIGERTPKGYMRAWFEDVWARYLDDPHPPSQGATAATINDINDLSNDLAATSAATSGATEAQHALALAFEAEERAKRAEGRLKLAEARLAVAGMKPRAALELLGGGEDDAA